jgi:hypothetical protein
MVQPDCAAVIPFGPVSWYGVASPWADSGFAGTTMSQLTLAAVVVAVLVADPVGQGAAELIGVVGAVPVVDVVVAAVVGVAVPDAAAVAVAAVVAVATVDAVAAVVAAAVLEAAAEGDAVLPDPWWWPDVLAGTTYAAGEAQLAFAASAMLFAPEWSTTMTIAPTATARATGMATGATRRASGRLERRRTDRCLLGMQSTSMS